VGDVRRADHRVAVVELRPDEGLLREALTSLYSLFATTRAILREHRPVVAQAKYSFGLLAVLILNKVLRPILAKCTPACATTKARDPRPLAGGPRAGVGLARGVARGVGGCAEHADAVRRAAGGRPFAAGGLVSGGGWQSRR
jgi:hypothetical protein